MCFFKEVIMSAAIPTLTKFPQLITELPGPKARAIVEQDHRYVSPSYTRPYPLVIERGWGAMIQDVDGNVFLDFNAGVAVLATGHAHPEIVAAIAKQAAEFVHIAGADYYYPQLAAMAERLQTETPGDFPKRVHFGNSGAEAVECALKVAMYATRRPKFIAFFNSFHGRTMGALSLTSSRAAQRLGFGRAALDVTHIPYANCLRCAYGKTPDTCQVECVKVIEERLFKTTCPKEEVAAVVVEAVQGEGGYVVPPAKFHHELRRLCDEHDIVLIVDEVQSGMGRTGKMFAIEHFGVVPDVLCAAKGIASGLPLSATVARADLMNWHVGAHASTFGGNPVAIAASLKTFELLHNGLLRNAAEMGERMLGGLRLVQAKYADRIADVRGLGLMIGVEFVTDRRSLTPDPELRNRIEQECFRRGLIVLGAGESTIRFSPPLVIDAEQVDCAVEIFSEAIGAALNA
ncbi:4-aminobutyrate aminotransferase apoenzyme [Chloracidobacterium thermophilum B]|uniref:4-aminobutyrate aminotransferase apoenzyme n=2 Tax=Chloracidobacterium thermophilum TaxID=458033 RepID=G2LHW0_CHLTF|nr:4-aminobutyrate aminotransferase apoenzyme [Chloracidobacterium thermophilum B]